MFNFNGITHINDNGSGHAPGYNFSLLGSVPVSMMDGRKPTPSDIMGGRVASNGLAYHGRKWETVQAIIDAAKNLPDVKLCDNPHCACRKLF